MDYFDRWQSPIHIRHILWNLPAGAAKCILWNYIKSFVFYRLQTHRTICVYARPATAHRHRWSYAKEAEEEAGATSIYCWTLLRLRYTFATAATTTPSNVHFSRIYFIEEEEEAKNTEEFKNSFNAITKFFSFAIFRTIHSRTAHTQHSDIAPFAWRFDCVCVCVHARCARVVFVTERGGQKKKLQVQNHEKLH